jgi:CBS domain-containing protein
MTVGEVCRRDVIITKPETPLVEAVALMKSYHVGDLVVVDGHSSRRMPVGILTDRDVALSIVSHAARIAYLRVSDLMKHHLITAQEGDSLRDALKKMQANGIRRLPVVDLAGELQGILTLDDLVELLSEEMTDLAKLVLREQRRERLQQIES